MNDRTVFEPLHCVAARLGLPESWLKGEAAAGRIPLLQVGRRMLFRFEAVERSLVERATAQGVPSFGGGDGSGTDTRPARRGPARVGAGVT